MKKSEQIIKMVEAFVGLYNVDIKKAYGEHAVLVTVYGTEVETYLDGEEEVKYSLSIDGYDDPIDYFFIDCELFDHKDSDDVQEILSDIYSVARIAFDESKDKKIYALGQLALIEEEAKEAGLKSLLSNDTFKDRNLVDFENLEPMHFRVNKCRYIPVLPKEEPEVTPEEDEAWEDKEAELRAKGKVIDINFDEPIIGFETLGGYSFGFKSEEVEESKYQCKIVQGDKVLATMYKTEEEAKENLEKVKKILYDVNQVLDNNFYEIHNITLEKL